MSAVLNNLDSWIHERTHTENLIVQISRLSTTALILNCWVKRPEIDEICRNLSYKGVNGWEFYETQTTMLCNTIILRKADVCPRKISHTFYKQSLFIFLQTVTHAIINVLPYEIVNVWKYELNPILIQFVFQIIVLQYWLNIRENRRH